MRSDCLTAWFKDDTNHDSHEAESSGGGGGGGLELQWQVQDGGSSFWAENAEKGSGPGAPPPFSYTTPLTRHTPRSVWKLSKSNALYMLRG